MLSINWNLPAILAFCASCLVTRLIAFAMISEPNLSAGWWGRSLTIQWEWAYDVYNKICIKKMSADGHHLRDLDDLPATFFNVARIKLTWSTTLTASIFDITWVIWAWCETLTASIFDITWVTAARKIISATLITNITWVTAARTTTSATLITNITFIIITRPIAATLLWVRKIEQCQMVQNVTVRATCNISN